MKSILVVLASAAIAAQTAAVAQVKLTPAEVAQFDLGKLGGTFVRQLAWAPDNSELFLESITEDKQALPKDFFYFVIPAAGGEFKKVAAPPAWVEAYWSWKAGQMSPDDASVKIDVSQDKRVQSATAIPMGGDLAKGGADGGTGGASADSVAAAARSSTNSTVYAMHLKGEIIGEWVDHSIVPGQTFGWGPKGTRLIAFTDKSAHLVLMDTAGAKQRVDASKNASFPAFNADGTKLAYLENRGGKKFAIIIAGVSR